MPNKCTGGWAHLELIELLCRVQALAFLSTTKFSIDGGWLNKWKLLSNSRRRNFSFLTTSTPSTAATTSAEKSHAFAKSRCSHRLFFFFGVSTKGTEAMTILDRSYTKTYKLVIGQLWYIFRLNSFGSKFRKKRLEFGGPSEYSSWCFLPLSHHFVIFDNAEEQELGPLLKPVWLVPSNE